MIVRKYITDDIKIKVNKNGTDSRYCKENAIIFYPDYIPVENINSI